MKSDRLVLAYSGGLDTSVALHQLASSGRFDVIAVLADVGQAEDLDGAADRARASGAAEVIIADLREEFADEFVVPAIAANGLYEQKYPLISSLSRPCIARALVRIARSSDAATIAHGCTGKGNDQVRFEVSIRALAPDIEIIAPIRTDPMSREEAISYANSNDIPVKATSASPYSIDMNVLGRTAECGILEDVWAPPPEDAFELTANPATVTGPPREVVLAFESGRPVGVDATPMTVSEIIRSLDAVGGEFGFGRIDMVENRRVGIKSREIYEAPGMMAVLMAHRDLEDLTLERDLAHEKQILERRWADLVYDGFWFAPLKKSLDAFFESSQLHVTGDVRLQFTPGSCTVTGRRSPASLYDAELSTYEEADSFRHSDAEGFIRIYGLGVETWARRQGDD